MLIKRQVKIPLKSATEETEKQEDPEEFKQGSNYLKFLNYFYHYFP